MDKDLQIQVDETLEYSLEHLTKAIAKGASVDVYTAFGQIANAHYSRKIAEYLKYIHLNNS